MNTLGSRGAAGLCSARFPAGRRLYCHRRTRHARGAKGPADVRRGVCGGLSVQETGARNGAFGADKFGFKDLGVVHWNLLPPQLYEHAITAGEASIVQGGALCAETGVHTGRSPKDKHTVVDSLTENTMWWDGNRKLSQANFQLLLDDFVAHARGKT